MAVIEKLFSSMMEESVTAFGSGAPIALPQEFSDCKVRNINFCSRFFQMEAGQLRSVYIESPKLEIFNLFFFPLDNNGPVYAMEFVRMGERMIVAVIDVAANPAIPQAMEQAAWIIRPHRESYPKLAQASDPPEWFEECRSGNDFFVRPDSIDAMQMLKHIHYEVLGTYSEFVQRVHGLKPLGDDLSGSWQASYKSHHAANSPGLPFLTRTFGDSWTNTYLNDHLFA